jgi:hypothetical protein
MLNVTTLNLYAEFLALPGVMLIQNAEKNQNEISSKKSSDFKVK